MPIRISGPRHGGITKIYAAVGGKIQENMYLAWQIKALPLEFAVVMH
jgi:hypothetical protein